MVERYNRRDTEFYAFFYGRTRLKNCFMPKKTYGKPLRVQFEDMMLPVPENYHDYLSHLFGDYMTPPPVENQVGLHYVEVDFGEY